MRRLVISSSTDHKFMIAYAREVGLFNTVIPTQIFAQFRNPKRDILSWLFSISRHTYFQYRKSRPPFCLNPEFRRRALYENQPKKLTGSCHVDCVLKTTVTIEPVWTGPVYSGHLVYYSHRTDFPRFSVALYFLQSWPVYSGHPVCNGHFAISKEWPFYTGLTVVHKAIK